MRILYFEGEPRWEYKFMRRAVEDDKNVEIISMLRTTPNKIYRQGGDANELANGFPTKAEELFVYDGLIIGSSEANYFTPGQQQLIRDFADKRGGGVLFLGGRFALSDGGWARSPLAEIMPVRLPVSDKTFFRDFSTVNLLVRPARTARLSVWSKDATATWNAGRKCRRLPTIRTSAT